MEVEHKPKTGSLYPCAQTLDVADVLAHSFILVVGGGQPGVDKQPYAHGIPTKLAEHFKRFYRLAFRITVDSLALFV